jgi:chromosome segregation ATPase
MSVQSPDAASLVSRARRRLGALRKTRVMVRDLRRQSNAQGKEQAKLQAQVAKLTTQVERIDKTIASLAPKVEPYVKASDLRALEHGRFSLQLGAAEERLGDLEQRISDRPHTVGEGTLPEAQELLDAVRREHQQIRVRMQIISAYEERLRRVEETCSALFDGDPRHLV